MKRFLMCILFVFISVFTLCYFLSSPLLALEEENPKVLIKTGMGDIVVEIYLKQAPITAGNFLRYVDAKLYDGTDFYRVVTLSNQPNNDIKIEVIQGGDVADEKCFPTIPHESNDKTRILHKDGVISMARGNPGTASCSFFICVNDQPQLDFGGKRNPDGFGFAAFGKVISGMDVVRKIQTQPEEKQYIINKVPIISITRVK
jgi:peptidyl-prolyl cis-trans isomerase A (cyclophilin A)